MPEFEHLKSVLSHSGCEKKQVACGTYVKGIWRWQVNTCFFTGSSCPRADLPSGVGYDLCEAIHAEVRLADEMKEEGIVSDGIAWVFGHYWACEPCASKLKSVGVEEIRIRNHSPENGRLGI